MADDDMVYRFGVGSPNGPRSGVYRLWAPAPAKAKPDVYLNLRAMGQEGKISLHEGFARVGLSKELAQAHQVDRDFLTWVPPSVEKTSLVEPTLQLIIVTAELHPESLADEDTSDVVWLPPAPEGGFVLLSLVIAEPGNILLADRVPRLLTTFSLGSGMTCELYGEWAPKMSPRAIERVQDIKRALHTRPPTWRLGDIDPTDPTSRSLQYFATNGVIRAVAELNVANWNQDSAA